MQIRINIVIGEIKGINEVITQREFSGVAIQVTEMNRATTVSKIKGMDVVLISSVRLAREPTAPYKHP